MNLPAPKLGKKAVAMDPTPSKALPKEEAMFGILGSVDMSDL